MAAPGKGRSVIGGAEEFHSVIGGSFDHLVQSVVCMAACNCVSVQIKNVIHLKASFLNISSSVYRLETHGCFMNSKFSNTNKNISYFSSENYRNMRWDMVK